MARPRPRALVEAGAGAGDQRDRPELRSELRNNGDPGHRPVQCTLAGPCGVYFRCPQRRPLAGVVGVIAGVHRLLTGRRASARRVERAS